MVGARSCSVSARRSLVLDADERDGTIDILEQPHTAHATRGSSRQNINEILALPLILIPPLTLT